MPQEKCPLCKRKSAVITQTNDHSNNKWYHCEYCGYFALMGSKVRILDNYSRIDELIFAINKLSNDDNYIELSHVNLDKIVDKVNFPSTPEEKIDYILEYISENEESYNQGIDIDGKDYRKFACKKRDDLLGIIDEAIARLYIEKEQGFSSGGGKFRLKPKGRDRVNKLKAMRRVDKNTIIEINNKYLLTSVMKDALESAYLSVENGNPNHAHDRMHTFLHDYLKNLCAELSIVYDSKKPNLQQLFSLIKTYVNEHSDGNDTAHKILRGLAKVIDAVAYARDRESLTHPSELLDSADALLVINSIKTIYVYLNEKLEIIQKSENFSKRNK